MKLLVDNLPPGTRQEDLRHLFSGFGAVTDVVMFDCEQQCKACALLSISGARLSAKTIAERVRLVTWKSRRLEVYEPCGLPEFPALRAVA